MPKTITIADSHINEKSPAYLVAEIGLNHNRSIEQAKKMILSAKNSGADAVKFQTYITEEMILPDSPAFDLFKNLELSRDDFRIITEYCRDIGITFFSTPLCPKCIEWLEELDVPCYKIASMDSDNYELIELAASTQKPVILSTGMSSLDIIEKAVATIEKAHNNKIIILHTISKYPPDNKDMNLRMIETLKDRFNYHIGFSDHTMDNVMAIGARTLGAVLFEKHFTLDKNLPGPDHTISLTPDDFTDLRKQLTVIDEGLSEHTGPRADMVIEKGARRSLYAACDIKPGTVITRDMIKVLRPANGLAPEHLSSFIGKQAVKTININQLLDLSCI